MLRVDDLMTRNPDTVTPETPLRTVLNIMKVDGCRQLPVVDADNKLVGIITDRDIRLAMNSPIVLHGRWQDNRLLETATADSCMTPNPITINSDSPAYRAAEKLSAYKFGALPVINKGELVGIITVSDFLDRFASEQPQSMTPGS